MPLQLSSRKFVHIKIFSRFSAFERVSKTGKNFKFQLTVADPIPFITFPIGRLAINTGTVKVKLFLPE
jgi:hypothetical protein